MALPLARRNRYPSWRSCSLSEARGPDSLHIQDVFGKKNYFNRSKEWHTGCARQSGRADLDRLKGKVALITGAARGLGAAMAKRFASEGASVVLADRDEAAVRETSTRLAIEDLHVAAIAADVTEPEGWSAMFSFAQERFGGADILVNNAGIAMLASIEETSLEDWRKIMSVNLDGVFLGTQAGIAHMRARGGGAIINMSSIRAMAGDPMSVAYDASKGGVLSLTRSAAVHCARQGYNIRINSLHPGYVMTQMVSDAINSVSNSNEIKSAVIDLHPIGRLGSEEEIANAALFLASDEASFMVGSAMVVDGGFTAV
ncbi:glucose 1-dehydrogenase [Novosphingobium pentaromativorans]|nr:glucose 1-dehydrogenase [Novosphingobium pentaromativorans]